MKRKSKLLVFLLTIVIFTVAAVSGLHVDVYNSIKNFFFGGEVDTHELIVQNVSAYSSASLCEAVESVGSVNILNLTLGNDLHYEGKRLQASPVTVDGSSAFYIDVNGHDLKINTDKSGGIFVGESTFYVVDTVSGGEIQIDTEGSGVVCKNLVLESGSLTVDAGSLEELEGPFVPSGFVYDESKKESIISSGNFDMDKLGGYWYSDTQDTAWFYGGVDHIYDGTGLNDAVRVENKAIIGNDANNVNSPCNARFHYQYNGNLYISNPFEKQNVPCGLRVGSFDWTVNDGTVIVQNLGGIFVATGPIGVFANTIELEGGWCEVFGSCGNGDPNTNGGFNMEAIVFSDPNGFDGHLSIGKNALVYASVPTDTAAIFSYCCEYFKCEGTLYSGCRSGYLNEKGEITMSLEACSSMGASAFSAQPHKEGETIILGTKHDVQRSAITIESGDVIFSGGLSNAFLLGNGCAISVGSDYRGIWGFGVDGSPGVAHNFLGYASWTENTTDGEILKLTVGNTEHVSWISSDQWSRIKEKNPVTSEGLIKDVTIIDTKFPTINYQLSYSGSYTQNEGAFVMACTFGTTENTLSDKRNSAALCVAGSPAGEEKAAVCIEGGENEYTKAYFFSNEIGILTTNASVKIGKNAFVSCDTIYAPERPQVTILDSSGGLAWDVVDWGTYCYKGISRTDKSYSNGSALLVERSGVMECHAEGGASGFTIGVDVPTTLKVRTGGTLRVVAESNGTNSETKHNYSMGIHGWGDVHIESGAVVQSEAGAVALRVENGSWACSLSVRGEDTYCSFVSRGGQFDAQNRLGWGSAYYGAVSISASAASFIYEGATVECSFADIYARKEVAFHSCGGLNVYGNAKVICTNAECGIKTYNDIYIYGNAEVNASNVKNGIEAEYFGWIPNANQNAKVSISGNAKVNVCAESRGIIGYKTVEISENAKVAVKTTEEGSSEGCICTDAGSGQDTVDISLEKDGTVCAYTAAGAYGINALAGNVDISGDGCVIAEGKTAGIHSKGNVNINVSSNSQIKAYGYDGCGIYATDTIDIKGEGTITAKGKEHGIFAGTKGGDSQAVPATKGNVKISGGVKVNAEGVLGDASLISGVSLVNESQMGNTTSIKLPKIDKYDSLQALGEAKGGFFATVSNNSTKSVLVSAGSSNGSDNARLLSRVNLTGGPEEIWYFDYMESGAYKGAWTIRNYINGCYVTVKGKASCGASLVLSKNLTDGCYFYIKKTTYSAPSVHSDKKSNGYVIYTGYVDGNTYKKPEIYGNDTGSKYCLTLNSDINQTAFGDWGTQINDYINTYLWANSDGGFTDDSSSVGGASSYNANQTFSIDAIVDLGDFFQTSVKNVSNGKHLDFVPAEGTYKWKDSMQTLEFFRDNTGRYPFSYRIADDSFYSLEVNNSNVSFRLNNNHAWQKFRIYYAIGSKAFSIKNVASIKMVGVGEGGELIVKNSVYEDSVRFILDGCALDAVGYAWDFSASRDSVFPSALYGDSVTYRIDLSSNKSTRFIFTTPYSFNVQIERWALFESSAYAKNIIGKMVQSGSVNGALDKIEVELKNPSTTYYFVVEAKADASFVGVGKIGFYDFSSNVGNSTGISASNNVEIRTSGKGNHVFAKGKSYGIQSGHNIIIAGSSINNAYGLSSVEAVSEGVYGMGVCSGGSITTSECTLKARGTEGGIQSSGNITVGDHSTVSASCISKNGYALFSCGATAKISVSPYASLFTSGKTVQGNGSVYPSPVSALDGKAAYEVKFHFATVNNKDESTRYYGKECFTSQLYRCNVDGNEDKKSGYSTLEKDYSRLAKYYFGIGHENDHALYVYLPEGSYVNYVNSYTMDKNYSNYEVVYDVAGYNRIDENGELSFTAKYDMGEYTNYSPQYATSAKVVSSRADVYPLEAFSLETFRIYKSSQGGELNDEEIRKIKENVSNSDGDVNYTWSEVRYYVENMAQGRVYIKAVKNSLAFSTITVGDGVSVELISDSNVKLLRGVFDISLNVDMDGIYEKPSVGYFPLQGEKDDLMLEGFDKIKDFFSPSQKAYAPYLKYPENGESNNGLTLPLFHLNGDSELYIGENIIFDNVQVTNGYKA